MLKPTPMPSTEPISKSGTARGRPMKAEKYRNISEPSRVTASATAPAMTHGSAGAGSR